MKTIKNWVFKAQFLFRIKTPETETYLLGCSTCNNCRASWLTTATLEALAFISRSNPSNRCFIISQSSISLPGTMVTNIFSFSLIHCSTPSASVKSLYKLNASNKRCFLNLANSWSSWYLLSMEFNLSVTVKKIFLVKKR